VQSYTRPEDNLLDYRHWWLTAPEPFRTEVLEARPQGGGLVASIAGPDGQPITDAKGRRSYVTSAGSAPSLGKHVLMTYLPPELAKAGQGLLVEYLGEQYPVTVAMVGPKPARVLCNTCKSQHSYKANAPGTSTKTRAPRSPRSAANRYQTLVGAKDGSAVKSYSIVSIYAEGDVFEHPMFGRGAVTAVKDGAKIEVLFETGTKTLVHAR